MFLFSLWASCFSWIENKNVNSILLQPLPLVLRVTPTEIKNSQRKKKLTNNEHWLYLRPRPTLRRRNLKTQLCHTLKCHTWLRLGSPSTLIRHENGALQKRSSNRRNLKTPTLRFSVDGKHFENGAFRKPWCHDNLWCDFSARVFLKHKSKMTSDCCVLNFAGVVWTKNIWCVFRVKPPFSNFSGVVWRGPQTQLQYIPRIWSTLPNGNLPRLLRLTALVFVYDYHPGAETLLMRHFSGPDSTLAVGPDGTLLFPSNPRAGGISNRHRPGGHRSPMPERLIWSYIIQLSSALRTVHASGLACRVIDPSKILLIGNSRWAFVCKPVSRGRRVEPKLGLLCHVLREDTLPLAMSLSLDVVMPPDPLWAYGTTLNIFCFVVLFTDSE